MRDGQNSNVPTLPALIERWQQVVEEVERGYSLTYDDYLNDVDLRQLIARAFRGVAPAAREQFAVLRESLHALDMRFMDVTQATQRCVWGDAIAEDEGWSRDSEWWYYREPRDIPEDW
jgi:hypothetical protein